MDISGDALAQSGFGGIMKRLLGIKTVILSILILGSSSYAAEMTQEKWMSFMTKNLPAELCSTGSHYRTCYEITAQECENTASVAAETCIGRFAFELPETLGYQAIREWGPKIGKCVEDVLDETYAAQKINSEACNK